MLQCSDSLWRTISTFYIPEYGVGQVVLCDLHDVLEVELGVGVVYARVLRQEGEAEHSDRLHAGFFAALSQPRNVVERINGLKWYVFVKYFFIERVYVDISWINSYHFDSGWVVTNGDIGEDVWHAAASLPHEEGLQLAELAVVVTPLPGVQPALGLVRHLEHLIGHLNIM